MLRVAFTFAALAAVAALMLGVSPHIVFGAFESAWGASRDVVSHSPYSFAGVLLLIGAAWMILSPRR